MQRKTLPGSLSTDLRKLRLQLNLDVNTCDSACLLLEQFFANQ